MFTLTTKLYGQPAQVYSPIPNQTWLDRQRDGLSALFGWRMAAPEISEQHLAVGPIYCTTTGAAVGLWSIRTIQEEV